jgi:hypothetical protein
LVFFVYLLGEIAGREGPSRNEHVKEIVKLEAELKNRKSDLSSKFTSPSFQILGLLLVIVVIFLLLVSPGDDHNYYMRRH